MATKKYRIGIDVGGTFTDAAMLDNDSFEIVAKLKIPTTHSHPDGVAFGIVTILKQILEETHVLPQDVAFIAHGTTQATNALLEGDVAKVGVIGMGTGIDAKNANKSTDIGNIELAKGKYLYSYHCFIDSKDLSNKVIDKAIDELLAKGAEVIVASEAYSVDDPTNEKRVIERALNKGVYATGGYEISQLYGLQMRTRTAVVNASLIPKMMETADMTEKAVKAAGIQSQLMIMRADGGVMSIAEVRKRPILTMLSGLAAGVAGALMYEKITDGIFFESGGTSTDISVIKDGKVMLKNAEVGGNKTYLKSLDVRTLGIAGGSMVMMDSNKHDVIDVGPRSAHIAGKEYEAFTDISNLRGGKVVYLVPTKGDTVEYAVIENPKGESYAYTLNGAANLLGYVPENDYAHGNMDSIKYAWGVLGEEVGKSAEEVARQVLNIALDKVLVIVKELIDDYGLESNLITLVGGGGSGSVVVPALGEREKMRSHVAKNAPFISTIGVGMAMVKETIEKSVIHPSKEDIKQIRYEAMEAIVKAGANEASVDISIEVDTQKNILRAVATGSTELRSKDMTQRELPDEKKKIIAAKAIAFDINDTSKIANTKRWTVFQGSKIRKSLFGLIKKKDSALAVVDREGVVRLKKNRAHLLQCSKNQIDESFPSFLEDNTIYSDANATIPNMYVFFNEKMLDLTGFQTEEQLETMMNSELELVKSEEQLIFVAYH
ncbi:hydantoinase/oxoprolinase family protein [Lapidilactobacillus luobeiensis]|uniref:hydantoinase/oxoprolinase family protein n=1 Tax=Lapidilactobacillus luobeiensis TaxID=2950371 RepID=UPI0021C32388|nr:hydantoinase/oxoprolinase family protein [Lapidilactobacillus luobeiensis]